MNQPPKRIGIFHIVHIDRLASIMAHGFLWSDSEAGKRSCGGTSIGIARIKERRLNTCRLTQAFLLVNASHFTTVRDQ